MFYNGIKKCFACFYRFTGIYLYCGFFGINKYFEQKVPEDFTKSLVLSCNITYKCCSQNNSACCILMFYPKGQRKCQIWIPVKSPFPQLQCYIFLLLLLIILVLLEIPLLSVINSAGETGSYIRTAVQTFFIKFIVSRTYTLVTFSCSLLCPNGLNRMHQVFITVSYR